MITMLNEWTLPLFFAGVIASAVIAGLNIGPVV